VHPDWESEAQALAARALADGEPTAWFDRLYAAGRRGDVPIPWDRAEPNALLVRWAAGRSGAGRRAVVVGCGLGRDSEFVAGLGYATTAFDVSETAVSVVQQRFSSSPVRYVVADLLNLPAGWSFDLVVESFTVQALPVSERARATAAVSGLVAPGGSLVVIAGIREDGEELPEGPPWPLTRAEVDRFGLGGLRAVAVRRVAASDPAGDRWLAEFGG
jgi:SAM-dependent methyltransferase